MLSGLLSLTNIGLPIRPCSKKELSTPVPCCVKQQNLSNSMEQSPYWEANRHSTSQEIPCLLWKPEVHYRVHKIPSQDAILNPTHQVHNFPPHFHKFHSNVTIPSTSRSFEWSLPFRFSDKNFVFIYHFSLRATYPTNLILLTLITIMICS